MLLSLYKYCAFTFLLLFSSPFSTLSAEDYFSKLKTAVSNDDINTVHQLLLQNRTDWMTENGGWEIASLAAEKGNLPIIQYIGERKLSILEKKNEQNETIGHIAAEHGHPNITEYFLKNTRRYLWRLSGSETQSLFDLIAKKGYLTCLMGRVSYYSDGLKRMGRIAAQNGHLDIACYMALEEKADHCKDFKDIILTAIKNSHKRDSKTLELFGKLTDEWSKVRFCTNIVELVSSTNNTELIEYLAEKKCTTFLRCDAYSVYDSCRSMEIAFERNLVDQNFLDCLEKENGTIHGYIGSSKRTIFHLAAEHDQLDAIRILADKNPSTFKRVDYYGRTIVDIAAKKGYKVVLYAVRQKPLTRVVKTEEGREQNYWFQRRHYPTSAFHLAIAKNLMDMDTLKYVVEKEGTYIITGADVCDGETVAHAAARNDNMEILQYLVKKQPSVLSKANSAGDTTLHILARKNIVSVEDLGSLADKGASLLTYNNLKENVPLIASKNGNLEIVKFVVKKEPSIFDGNASIEIAMTEIAACNGHPNIIKFIVDKKPTLLANRPSILFKLPNASQILDTLQYLKTVCEARIINWDRRQFESEILHKAFEYDYSDVLQFMEYDVNMLNETGEPLIFAAVRRERPNCFYFLANDRRTNLTALDHEGNNILFIAAMNRDLEKIQYILDTLKVPIDIEWRNYEGNSLLHVAVHEALTQFDGTHERSEESAAQTTRDDIGVIKYLVEKKRARTDTSGHANMTALHCAARSGNYFISNYLLDHGARPKLRDANGSNFWQAMHFPTLDAASIGTSTRDDRYNN